MSVHAGALPACVEGAVMFGAVPAAAGGAIVTLGRPGAPPCAILKITTTPEGRRALARETAVLTVLHADNRLGGWRELLPRPRAQGTLRGHCYRLDSALAGRAVMKSPRAGLPELLSAAAETISVLHEKTATTIRGGPEVAERWVDAPLRELVRHARGPRVLSNRLALLRDELHGALSAGPLPAAWIHGDYWLGNLLFLGMHSPSGIVDWETAAPLELPLHDVLHLLFYTRRLHTGRDLGQLVSEELRGQEWSREERAVLNRHWAWPTDDSLSRRHLLLLYWLRHVGGRARQSRLRVSYRYRLWERRNVLPVLEAL
jgi:hypothetical protein